MNAARRCGCAICQFNEQLGRLAVTLHHTRTRHSMGPTNEEIMNHRPATPAAPVDIGHIERLLMQGPPAPWATDGYRVYGPPEPDQEGIAPLLFSTKQSESRHGGYIAEVIVALRNQIAPLLAELKAHREEKARRAADLARKLVPPGDLPVYRNPATGSTFYKLDDLRRLREEAAREEDPARTPIQSVTGEPAPALEFTVDQHGNVRIAWIHGPTVNLSADEAYDLGEFLSQVATVIRANRQS